MMVVDRALEQRQAEGRPVRAAIFGAGTMGRGVARQIIRATPGMEVAVIVNRTLDAAARAYVEAGADAPVVVRSTRELREAIAAGRPAITDDPAHVLEADVVDVVLEVTGALEYGARVALDAMAAGLHVALMNAELDGTVGPILKRRADAAGVVLTNVDGDQPGVEANLLRFVRMIGLRPLVAGNIKGLQDRFRTPTTQAGFAAQWGQSATMVTSFADGTKVSYEQAIVANATGFRAPRRGLNGWDHHGHVDELVDRYDVDELEAHGGIVDYVVGAQPSPGVYVIGAHHDAYEQQMLKLYKKGDGPLYSFYTPQHLCHFEVPISLARIALLREAILAPLAGPAVEVVATAKRNLRAGEQLDGIGGYDTYGECENADVTERERLLPMGVAEGARLLRDVPIDRALTYDDVELPPGRLIDALRAEQAAAFAPVAAAR